MLRAEERRIYICRKVILDGRDGDWGREYLEWRESLWRKEKKNGKMDDVKLKGNWRRYLLEILKILDEFYNMIYGFFKEILSWSNFFTDYNSFE